MNVLIEGPDGAGKSTLAARVVGITGLRLQEGAGPPRGPGEIERRAETYLAMDGVVFDRHPLVSQPIYGALRGETLSPRLLELTEQLYASRPIVVYCRASDPSRHVVKADEDPAHVRELTERYAWLVEMYDKWAVRRAHLLYRIGDSSLDVVGAIAHVVRSVGR